MKNRLKYFRHQMMMNKTEMAEFLGVNYRLYVQWENTGQLPSSEWLFKIWQKVSTHQSINMQDLIDSE